MRYVLVIQERLGEIDQRCKRFRILLHTHHIACGPISEPGDRHQSHLTFLVLYESSLLALRKRRWHGPGEFGRRDAVAALVAVLENVDVDGALCDDMVDMDFLRLAVSATASDCLRHGGVELVLGLRQ